MIRSSTNNGPMSARQRRLRGMKNVSGRDLFLLFDEWADDPLEAEPGGGGAAGEAVAEGAEETEQDVGPGQALLTFGGTPLVVDVRSELEGGTFQVDPLEYEDEMCTRLDDTGRKRLALEEALAMTASCEAEVSAGANERAFECREADDLPLFREACSLEDEMAGRFAQGAETRDAVSEMMETVAACEASARVGAADSAPQPDAPAATEPEARPRVTRFTPSGPKTDVSGRQGDGGRAALGGRLDPREEPFSWRRLFLSATVSGGLGTAALLAIHWIAQ